jgi:hypothetical protein
MSVQYGAISRVFPPKGNGGGVKILMAPRNEITPFSLTLKTNYNNNKNS